MPGLNGLSEYDANAGLGVFPFDERDDLGLEVEELFGGEGADVVEVELEGVGDGGGGGRGGGEEEEGAGELGIDCHCKDCVG